MFEWMAWTLAGAVFFICIALMLLGMTIWELISPSDARKGLLFFETTRGDRLFIGLLCAAYINLGFVGFGEYLAIFLALDSEPSLWYGFVFSMFVLVAIIRKG